MAGGLVLLTGGTGHVGYATLIEALRVGYQVRVAIRRESSIAELKATKSIQPYLSNVSFVIVKDIITDGAFDKAVKGVDYVVHIASPIPQPSDDDEATIIQPAIRGTTGILYSALKEPSIKRMVITSSIAAVAPPEAWGPGFEGVLTPQARIRDRSGPYDNYMMAYAASKVAAYNRTLDFVAKEQPSFDVINVLPTFVIGKKSLLQLRKPSVRPTGQTRLR
jgi:nucleoside-diphosphate-sugar epimerase